MIRSTIMMAGAAIITAALLVMSPPEAPGAIGDVVHWIPASGTSWAGGGITWRDGYLWEHVRDGSHLYQRDPSSGQTVGSVPVSNDRGVTLAWDSIRENWLMTEPYHNRILRFLSTGGNAIGSYDFGLFESGLACDRWLDRIWVGDNQYSTGNTLSKWSPDGWRDGPFIDPGFTVQAVTVTGSHVWVSNFTDGGHNNYIYQLNKADGARTGVSFGTPGDEPIGALCFDGQYIWGLATSQGVIYQIDIGITPIPPTPTPTPASLILDSGDYNGDSTSDIAIFRKSSGLWAVRGITRAYFGGSSDIPASGDFNGDGTTDLALFRPAPGLWAVKGITRSYFGGSSDIPAPGDYDGDATCDAGIYRGSSGLWAVKGITRSYFGGSGDLPVPVYGGAGESAKHFGIFRPSTRLWAIRGITRTYYGGSSDQPVPANYSGIPDSIDIGTFRGSSGLWAIKDVTRIYFGASNDWPVPGNFTGFIPADTGIFRPASGLWAIRGVTRVYFGGSSDLPVSGLAINPSSAAIP